MKRLRDMTGVGMMDCKKALTEANGDFDKAVELLRKTGQKVAANRADREANEGLIVTAIADDSKTAAIVEVNCETDFVARNDDFQTYANDIVQIILANRPADLDALLALEYQDGRSVADSLIDQTGKIGEKIDIRRFEVVETDGRVVSYIHPGSRLGVLVDVSADGPEEAAVDVAMQAAALNPIATKREDVPEEITTKEFDIARETAVNEGKPENIVDRIAQGKLDRYFKDNVLLEQPFVKDSSVTVGEMVKKGRVVSYIHPGSRLGVLVDVSADGPEEAAVDVAMQAAALNPIATKREDVPEEITTKEFDIARETAVNEGKPENIVDRIAQGKLDRYFKDNVLLEQPFVKDSSVTVGEMVKKAGIEVRNFVRFSLGD